MNNTQNTPTETFQADADSLFGIVIPNYASDVASAFRQATMAPTTNATIEESK